MSTLSKLAELMGLNERHMQQPMMRIMAAGGGGLPQRSSNMDQRGHWHDPSWSEPQRGTAPLETTGLGRQLVTDAEFGRMQQAARRNTDAMAWREAQYRQSLSQRNAEINKRMRLAKLLLLFTAGGGSTALFAEVLRRKRQLQQQQLDTPEHIDDPYEENDLPLEAPPVRRPG